MKICYHTGPETDPDERDRQTDRGDIDILQRYITRCFPGLVPIPAVVESCMYTVSITRFRAAWGSRVVQWSKALHLSARGVTTDPGLIPG